MPKRPGILSKWIVGLDGLVSGTLHDMGLILFAVVFDSLMIFLSEALGDTDQAFGGGDDEKTVGEEAIGETVVEDAPGFLREIDRDIAAENEVLRRHFRAEILD